jgi:hypothetical protein
VTPYENLVTILDNLRGEAPESYKSYHPPADEPERLNSARSKALLHLFLKVRFGLLDFAERETYVTEGTDDGGIDAYYIDFDRKIIHFLQAKFRTSEKNFEEKTIDAEELLMMDINRVLDGYTTSEAGKEYNQKVLRMAKRIREIGDIGRYRYKIAILANARGVTKQKLMTLTGGFPVELIDYKACYSELLFPLISGTYYKADELQLSLNLSDKSAGAKISYTVTTEFTKCEITVVFVPTLEIAKVMYKYRNSILEYNPRSYLGHEGKGVNSEIRKSIEARATNEFALFNNGITILSDATYLNERIGQKDRAQLILVNPQIINGGQTAYTLSIIFREHMHGNLEAIFGQKEVLVKIITFQAGEDLAEDKKVSLIEDISRATNQQTAVTSADRRSNERNVKELQKKLFDRTGLFLERKRGEFEDGVREGYIRESEIVDRTLFYRAALAARGKLRDATAKKLAAIADYAILADANGEMLDRYAFSALLLSRMLRRQKNRLARLSNIILMKLYFGLELGFKLGMSVRDRAAAVAYVDKHIDKAWRGFEDFYVGKFPDSFFMSQRSVKPATEKYLTSSMFKADLKKFLDEEFRVSS